MIGTFTEDLFGKELANFFTPARPISKENHLHGRTSNLLSIKRALQSPGKHVFIYGDRGVGKTSLAKTAASINSAAGIDYIFVSCDNSTTFFNVVEGVIKEFINIIRLSNQTLKVELNLGIVKITKDTKTEEYSVKNINDAISVLQALINGEAKERIIIIDEFDLITNETDKKYTADFLKQLSDREINLRVIICGIGSSLVDLIGAHLSTERYLSPIELKPLSHDALWKIIESAGTHLKVEINREFLIRISQISDGFPYYIHLMGEKIFWQAQEDTNVISEISANHYKNGIRAAIEDSQTLLRQAYEKATQKYNVSTDYEEVLWAVADGDPSPRASADIYNKSYKSIMHNRRDREALKRETFNTRLNALKSERHGSIVTGTRQGWYKFKENMVRGYVRLRAEDAGIKIGVDSAK